MAPKTKDENKPKLPFGSNDLANTLYTLRKHEARQRRRVEETKTTGLVGPNRAWLDVYTEAIEKLESRAAALGYREAFDYNDPIIRRDVEAQYLASKARHAANRAKRADAPKAAGKAKAKKGTA